MNREEARAMLASMEDKLLSERIHTSAMESILTRLEAGAMSPAEALHEWMRLAIRGQQQTIQVFEAQIKAMKEAVSG